MRLAIALRRLARDRRGVTIVEFALVVPVLMLLLLGTLELGYKSYVSAMVQGAMGKAARLASIGNKSSDDVENLIKSEVGQVVSATRIDVGTERYYNFSNVGKPEKILQDTDPKGVYNVGDCYEDANNNGRYDSAAETGVGTADDIVYYSVKVTYPNITPVGKFVSALASNEVQATTVMRNQPFTSRAAPVTRCD